MTISVSSLAALSIFAFAYALVVFEDKIELSKSVPVLVASGFIWLLVPLNGDVGPTTAEAIREYTVDFAELFLFLISAIAYISAIGKRNVFRWLGARLVSAGFGLRSLFWATGSLAFLLSPIADNLTTAILLGSVVVAVAGDQRVFAASACTNIVVAANAGGAFSPFGDITTLMAWQSGVVPGAAFLHLVVPALVAWIIPAAIMQWSIPHRALSPVRLAVDLKDGWWVIVLLFLSTIATAIIFFVQFDLPPFLGMTTGLGYYMVFCYWECRRRGESNPGQQAFADIAEVHWDTLLFFLGVILCVGGLAEFGYLEWLSTVLFDGLGSTWASVILGVISAVLDNVPVMFAVLTMQPELTLSQWLLVTLTIGMGGSILSIGSAAGVALMGVSKAYTFSSHLRWVPVILLGYGGGIIAHLWINASL